MLPYFPFYPRDWLTGQSTAVMTPEQRGGFIHLLAHAWLSEPPCTLPDDDAMLAILSGMGAVRWKKAGAAVRERFQPRDDGRLRNAKQWHVYLDAVAFHERKVAAGAKGGRPQKARDNQTESYEKAEVKHSLSTAKAEDKQNESCAKASSLALALAPALSEKDRESERARTPGNTPRRGPLVSAGLHRNHASCGRPCVPATLHERLVNRLAMPQDEAETAIRAWYRSVQAAWEGRDIVPADDFQFWTARFDEWKPAPVKPRAVAGKDYEGGKAAFIAGFQK